MKTLMIVIILLALPWGLVNADCCDDEFRGDVNEDNEINMQDVTDLSGWMFDPEYEGPTPCMTAADTDASGGPIDIWDLMFLINYVLHEGPSPAACP